MKGLYASVWAETLKVRKSKMLLITLLAFSGIAIMLGLMIFVTRNPELAANSAMVSAKSSMFKDDWSSYFGLFIMMTLTLGTIGFGIVTSWVFGREYSDNVVKDLLALPISRFTIVLSKFITIIIWSSLLSLILFVCGLLTGFAVNIANWSAAIAYSSFITFMVTSALTILMCTPVALIASFSRGYLAPFGFVIAVLVITQILFVGVPGITLYFPWAIPALYSGISGSGAPTPGLVSYIILISTIILGFIGTAAWWRFADQN
jgi:ABC-2 type transport system permease protein